LSSGVSLGLGDGSVISKAKGFQATEARIPFRFVSGSNTSGARSTGKKRSNSLSEGIASGGHLFFEQTQTSVFKGVLWPSVEEIVSEIELALLIPDNFTLLF